MNDMIDAVGGGILSVLGAMGAVMMVMFIAVVCGWVLLAANGHSIRVGAERDRIDSLRYMARLTLIFQLLHFAEHALQVGMLIAAGIIYMSPVAEFFEAGFALLSGHYMNMAVGMEFLHLSGNFIFFMGIVAWLLAGYQNKWMRAVAWLQGFHVLEHVSLTVTKLELGTPLGFSTLFGLHADFISGYRVWWHFTMNLIATVMVIHALRKERILGPSRIDLQPVLPV